MNIERIALGLTVVNLVILASSAARVATAAPQQQVQMLRGTGLEIVDERGRRRAQLIIVPASTTPNGAKYAETQSVATGMAFRFSPRTPVRSSS